MQVHHCRSAGRRYTVITGLDAHQQPEAVAKDVAADAATDGSDGIVVVSPPASEKDAALGLHTYTPDAAPRPANGVDAMCAYHALRQDSHGPADAAEFRFAGRTLEIVGQHNDPHRMEVDLGRPGLDGQQAGLSTDRVEAVDGTHTFEVPVGGAGETMIVTLVRLVGLHAVAFGDDLGSIDLPRLGEALKELGLPEHEISAHAVKIQEPGWLDVRSWDAVTGVGEASGFGLGAICAAGVTMCCTIAANAVRCSEGELSAGWDGDGHVRLRGYVEEDAAAVKA